MQKSFSHLFTLCVDFGYRKTPFVLSTEGVRIQTLTALAVLIKSILDDGIVAQLGSASFEHSELKDILTSEAGR